MSSLARQTGKGQLARRCAVITSHLTSLEPAVALKVPVCLILGAGAGIGQAVARRFAEGGYHVCLVRRGPGKNSMSDAATVKRFEEFASDLRATGAQASTFYADATSPEELGGLIRQIESDVGPIEVACYNVGAQVGHRSLEKTSYRIYELAWRMGSLGAFAVAKEVAPLMAKRGKGTILYTSSTAAFRGNAGQYAHAAAMAGRRMMAQALSHEYGPQGVHVVHVNVDGPVNAPETLGKLMPDMFESMKALDKDRLLDPRAIAETYWHLHQQPKNAWSFELDLRPFLDTPWYNT